MAELPRVEQFRRLIASQCTGLRIRLISGEKKMMLRGMSLAKLQQIMGGQYLLEVQRHGKMIFLRLDKGWFYMHFGPMGYPFIGQSPAISKQAVLAIRFHSGKILQVHNRRRIGEFGWVADKNKFLESRSYGPDALAVTQEEFLQRIRRRRAGIKAVLTNQDMVAGIGNAYADEILFRCGIHPHTPTSGLTEPDLEKIYRKMLEVFRIAVHSRRPGTLFFVSHRRESIPCPVCRTPIRKKYVMKRSAYYCPVCQP